MRIFLYLLLFLPSLLLCQNKQTIYLDAQNYSLEKAKSELEYVCQHLGIRNNYQLIENNKANIVAKAYKKGSRRYIEYNRFYMQNVYENGDTSSWATIAVFLHEIAHHLNGDTESISSHNRLSQELKADYFMGFHLQKMGATKDQAVLVLNFMSDTDGFHFHGSSYSISHPPKKLRIIEVQKGWDNSKSLNSN